MADQLPLFQPGGTDYAHLITTGTPGFLDFPTALVSRPAGGKVLLSTGPSGNCIPERVEQTIFPVFALI